MVIGGLLLFSCLKIKNLSPPSPMDRHFLNGGLGGLLILFLLKEYLLRETAMSTKTVNTRVKSLIKNKGMALWEFCMALWEFCMALWEFDSCQVIHNLSTTTLFISDPRERLFLTISFLTLSLNPQQNLTLRSICFACISSQQNVWKCLRLPDKSIIHELLIGVPNFSHPVQS